MDEITKTGRMPLKDDEPVYVVVCYRCKDAFRTNDREEKLCGDCLDYEWTMNSEWDNNQGEDY